MRGGRAVQGDLDHLGVVCRLGGAVLAGAHGDVFWLWRGVEDEGDEWGQSQGEEREKVLVQEGIRHGRLFEEATKLDLSHWSASCDSSGHLSHSREWFAR